MPDNPQPPDMIAQAGELVKMLQQGQKIAVASSPFDTADRAIVLASAILAVAAELRAIDNHLADLVDAAKPTDKLADILAAFATTRQDGAA